MVVASSGMLKCPRQARRWRWLLLGLLLIAGAAQAQPVKGTGYQLFDNDTERAGFALMLPALVTVPTFGIIDLVGASRPSPLPVWYGHLELWLAGLPTTTGAVLLIAAGDSSQSGLAVMMLSFGAALSGHGLYTIFRDRSSAPPPVHIGFAMDGHGGKLVSAGWRY
jgi:hypothetical protein